jgi:hypothetical protein
MKPICDFTARQGRVKPVHSWCKKCLSDAVAIKRKIDRSNNPLPPKRTEAEKLETRRQCRHRQREDFRIFIGKLKDNACVDCGQKFNPVCMDFDHLDGYERSCIEFSELRGRSKKIILSEIAKCELVCSNCHRVRTQLRIGIKNGFKPAYEKYNRRPCDMRKRKQYDELMIELKSSACKDCGNCFPAICMDFDHIHSKIRNIASMWERSKEEILVEAAKCEIVCSNCHRIRTKNRKDANTKAFY